MNECFPRTCCKWEVAIAFRLSCCGAVLIVLRGGLSGGFVFWVGEGARLLGSVFFCFFLHFVVISGPRVHQWCFTRCPRLERVHYYMIVYLTLKASRDCTRDSEETPTKM